MTVQELIDKLLEIENKSMEVIVDSHDGWDELAKRVYVQESPPGYVYVHIA